MVAVLAVLALRSPMFDVDHIEVDGEQRTDEEDVLAAAGITKGTPLMDVDTSSASDAIEELPYVVSASVRHDWPNTVSISIEERTPLLELVGGGSHIVVADDGVVVDVVDHTVGLVPVLASGDALTLGVGDTYPAADATALAAQVGRNMRPWIDRIEIDPQRGLVVNLVGTAEATVGSAEAVDEKLISLATVLGRVDLACVREIDVTVADSPIVRRACT